MSAGGIVAHHFAEVGKCQMQFQAFWSSTPIFVIISRVPQWL